MNNIPILCIWPLFTDEGNEDRDFLKFLWRHGQSRGLQEFFTRRMVDLIIGLEKAYLLLTIDGKYVIGIADKDFYFSSFYDPNLALDPLATYFYDKYEDLLVIKTPGWDNKRGEKNEQR